MIHAPVFIIRAFLSRRRCRAPRNSEDFTVPQPTAYPPSPSLPPSPPPPECIRIRPIMMVVWPPTQCFFYDSPRSGENLFCDFFDLFFDFWPLSGRSFFAIFFTYFVDCFYGFSPLSGFFYGFQGFFGREAADFFKRVFVAKRRIFLTSFSMGFTIFRREAMIFFYGWIFKKTLPLPYV